MWIAEVMWHDKKKGKCINYLKILLNQTVIPQSNIKSYSFFVYCFPRGKSGNIKMKLSKRKMKD